MYDDHNKRIQFGIDNEFPISGPETRFLTQHIYILFTKAINGKVCKPLADYLELSDGKEMKRIILELGSWKDD